MSHLGFERGFGRFNETRMYGRGRGLAEEAEHGPKPVLQLSVMAWAIRDPPRFTIANANGDGA